MKLVKITLAASALAAAAIILFAGCPGGNSGGGEEEQGETLADTGTLEAQPAAADLAALFDTEGGFPGQLANSWKIFGFHNALFTQGFGADPTAFEYDGRLYVFASNDSLMYDADGNPNVGNATAVGDGGWSYAEGIQGVRSVSSADMVNWTDHGVLNITGTKSTNPLIPDSTPIIYPGTFATASWAPSATWKMINGSPQFFIYWGNTGNGIGVITAPSPTGPWSSPLDKLLIDRDTPNCAGVDSLFDPGVMVDDDGTGYIFFGGGSGSGNGRRARLGADMISLDGDPQAVEAPMLFEDNEIFKFEGRYYYSYVGTDSEIKYMVGDNPMGEFSDPVGIMRTPSHSSQLNTQDENNHHCIFIFRNRVFIAYHAQTVKGAMGYTQGKGARSTHIDEVNVALDGAISRITMTRKGVNQIGRFNPYAVNEAETIGIMGGIFTCADEDAGNGMVVTSIDSGDWIALYGVDFGSSGAKKFAARVRMPQAPADYTGAIELRIDPVADGVTPDSPPAQHILNTGSNTARIKGGTVIGRVQLKAKDGEQGKYSVVTIELDQPVTGVHDLAFVFYSSIPQGQVSIRDSHHRNGFEFDQWQFLKE